MPESIPLASVSSAASMRLAAILRHASDTGVASGSVSARAKRSFFTVLSGSAADLRTRTEHRDQHVPITRVI
jgi:hypothetical protein